MTSPTEVETLPGMAAERDVEDPSYDHGNAVARNGELARWAAEKLEQCIEKHREELHGLLRSFSDCGMIQKRTHRPNQEARLQEPFSMGATHSPLLEPVVPQASLRAASTKHLCAPTMSRWTFSEADRQDLNARNSSVKQSLADIRALEEQQNVWLRIIRHPWFDRAGAVMIISNSCLTGTEVQYAAAHRTNSLPAIFAVLQLFFCIVFTVELVIRINAAPSVRKFFKGIDKFWSIFDALVVFSSILEIALTYIEDTDKSLLLIARMIRIVRIARIIRVVRFLRQLRTMVMTLLNTLPSLAWSIVLIIIIIFMFASAITGAVTQHLLDAQEPPPYREKLVRHFGSLHESAYSLFTATLGGLSWDELTQVFLKLHWFYPALFLVYLCILHLAMLNVITGFFCESAFDIIAVDKEEVVMQMKNEKDLFGREFKEMFDAVDADKSGEVTFNEMEAILADEAFHAYLSHFQIPVTGAWNTFRLLDKDKSGSVSIDEFVDGLLNLKGQSKTIDMASLAYDLKRQMDLLAQFMQFVDLEFQKIHARGALHVPAPSQHSKPAVLHCGSDG
eukprot:TRINITY_DN61443_c0_g1_i1.p1 TRINITY_DN61443_c0_g1~~TRINITY_DN61443_c0_g1_i1.p1  ORF type:complete len:563 (-),score=70.04 TRINITY_DN61443_c0_g1_i1:45-1733(-)